MRLCAIWSVRSSMRFLNASLCSSSIKFLSRSRRRRFQRPASVSDSNSAISLLHSISSRRFAAARKNRTGNSRSRFPHRCSLVSASIPASRRAGSDVIPHPASCSSARLVSWPARAPACTRPPSRLKLSTSFVVRRFPKAPECSSVMLCRDMYTARQVMEGGWWNGGTAGRLWQCISSKVVQSHHAAVLLTLAATENVGGHPDHVTTDSTAETEPEMTSYIGTKTGSSSNSRQTLTVGATLDTSMTPRRMRDDDVISAVAAIQQSFLRNLSRDLLSSQSRRSPTKRRAVGTRIWQHVVQASDRRIQSHATNPYIGNVTSDFWQTPPNVVTAPSTPSKFTNDRLNCKIFTA